MTHTDTRPRVAFVLPDGKCVDIIFDHGDVVPDTVTFEIEPGSDGARQIVVATKAK